MEHFDEIKGSVDFEDGILHMKHLQGAELNKEDMEHIFSLQQKITRQNAYCLLIDMRGNVTVTEEAAEMGSQNPNSEYIKASAIITDSGPSHAGAKFYISLETPNIETQVFLSEEEARKWLAGF